MTVASAAGRRPTAADALSRAAVGPRPWRADPARSDSSEPNLARWGGEESSEDGDGTRPPESVSAGATVVA